MKRVASSVRLSSLARLHLGEIGVGLVSVDVKLGLDAEHDPATTDQLLELGGPGTVDLAGRVLIDLAVVDVLVHQDAGLDASLGRFRRTQSVLDDLSRRSRHFSFRPPNGVRNYKKRK